MSSVEVDAVSYGNDVAMDINTHNNIIKFYFQMGLTDREIVQTVQQLHQLSINECHVWRQLLAMNLRRRSYGNLEDTVAFTSDELHGSGRLLGYRIMHETCKQHGLII